MRMTRAASKRAVNDEVVPGGPHEGRHKRQALADITNDIRLTNPSAKPTGTTHSTEIVSALESSSQITVSGCATEPSSKALSTSANVASTGSHVSLASNSRSQALSKAGSKDGKSSLETAATKGFSASKVASGAESSRKSWATTLAYTCIDSNPTDPQMCTAYAADIYQHLRNAESRRRPTTDFMELRQQDITASMRGILIDWLVEVAEEYKLVPDTLYLTCSYVDRYLSHNVVGRSRLQLLGVTCMLIAAKYEEIYAPKVDEFCYITDNTYQRDEVVEMEKDVLNQLHFDLSVPTTKSFLRRFVRAAQASLKVPSLNLEYLGNYLSELTLVEYSFLKYLPSRVAASAVFLAKLTLNPEQHPWTPTLEHYTQYRPRDLRECVLELHELQLNKRACTLRAIREKFKNVSCLPPPLEIAPQFFQDAPDYLHY
eukprot:TRINITY_DN8512_c0_g2_i1.p1 TRINITY_DN8512_c0_g2~~TRINITY_DN8512_c0_g2_i1.p1  ORF type:complete len:430 (+),score=53.89 TRINITY_DN8512_c0_g2_i1:283-1572(+)